jgi:cytidine deaminase
MDDETLMKEAREASENSYSPYSKFQVGAAVLTKNGDVFTGCNVENASYGLSLCAERAAISHAVCAGKKRGDFIKIAVAGRSHTGDWQDCSPCGACRQFIYEFVEEGQTVEVIYLDKRRTLKSVPIDDLLPDGFTFCK